MCDVNNTTLCYTHSLRTTLPFLNVLCHLCSLGAANNPKWAQRSMHNTWNPLCYWGTKPKKSVLLVPIRCRIYLSFPFHMTHHSLRVTIVAVFRYISRPWKQVQLLCQQVVVESVPSALAMWNSFNNNGNFRLIWRNKHNLIIFVYNPWLWLWFEINNN